MPAALAFAFHFDRPIVEDLGLIETLLALPIGADRVADLLQRQTYMPLATGKVKKPAAFRWPRLVQLVDQGDVVFFGMRTDTSSGDDRQVELYFDSVSLANREPAAYQRGRDHRYVGHVSFGSAVLAGTTDVDALVVMIAERFARHIGLVAGVVVADAVHIDAVRIATASGGLPGTEMARRCSALFGASFTWGTFAREPEWGTFLQRRHADAIGGPPAIRSAVEPHALLELGELVYVQVTPYADALTPTAEAKRDALEALMRPVLDGPSSRQPP